MYKIAHVFTNAHQVSVPEAAYLCLSELCLTKFSASVLYVSINMASERVSMLKSEKEILEIPRDHDEIFKSGIVEYYMMRPNQDDLKNICLAVLFLIIIVSCLIDDATRQILLWD